MNNAKKKAIAALIAAFILGAFFGCVIALNVPCARAAAPRLDNNNAATAMIPLKISEMRKLHEVAQAEAGLGVLRSTTSNAVPLCIYATSSGSLYTFHMLVGPSGTQVTISGIVGTGHTSTINFNGPSYGNYKYQYAWVDTSDGGWIYTTSLSNGNITIPCDFVIGYRSAPNAEWTDLTQNPANVISGSGELGVVAQSWLDTWDVKVNGANNHYIDGYNDGYADGREEGFEYGYETGYESGRWDAMHDPDILDPIIADAKQEAYEDGYNTGYAEGYTDGYSDGIAASPAEPGTTVIVSYDLDIPAIVGAPMDVTNRLLDVVDFEVFGINLAGLLATAVLVVVIVYIVKKVM